MNPEPPVTTSTFNQNPNGPQINLNTMFKGSAGASGWGIPATQNPSPILTTPPPIISSAHPSDVYSPTPVHSSNFLKTPQIPQTSQPSPTPKSPTRPTHPHPQAMPVEVGFDSLGELTEYCSELFAIFSTVERLEKGYMKDCIDSKNYEIHLKKLMTQFKTVKTAVSKQFPDIQQFLKLFSLECPAAVQRLLVEGIPATISNASGYSTQSGSNEKGRNVKLVAETVQHFINLMDILQLKIQTVDELLPLSLKLFNSLNTLGLGNLEGHSNLKARILSLNQMTAGEKISEGNRQQFLLELDTYYAHFHGALNK